MHFHLDDIRFFSSRMPPVYASESKTAGLNFTNDDDVDTVKELQDAISDISDALDAKKKHNAYDKKIIAKIIKESESDDYDIAKTEWSLKKNWADPTGGVCEVCGHHPIVYHFQIKNRFNHTTLVLGSSCIINYVVLEGFSAGDLARYMNRLRQRLKDQRFNDISRDLLDVWDKQDEVYASLKTMVARLPSNFDIAKFARRLWGFRNLKRDLEIKACYAKYIQNIQVMVRMMDHTFGETVIQKIPDKIQRKQKLDRKKITDQKKLELFIEFETQIKLLMLYGTPTEAYDLILEEIKEKLRDISDNIDAKRDGIIADVSRHFATLKRSVGSRSRLKDYIDSWNDMVAANVKEKWSTYESRLTNIDSLLSGYGRIPSEPETRPEMYIRVYNDSYYWPTNQRDEHPLYVLVKSDVTISYQQGRLSWNTPQDSPLRLVTDVDSDNIRAALLDEANATTRDRDFLALLPSMVLGLWGANHLQRLPRLMERLFGSSPAIQKQLAEAKAADDQAAQDAAAAKAVAVAAEAAVAKEWEDMIEQAETYAANDWEKKFIKDMARKYNKVSDLSPKQLAVIKRVSTRSTVPQPTPAQSSKAMKNQAPAGAKSVAFADFIEDCKTTMSAGREGGFVQSITRRYRSWNDVSPRQQKWLTDIYTRGGGRDMPDHIT